MILCHTFKRKKLKFTANPLVSFTAKPVVEFILSAININTIIFQLW